MDEKLKLYAVRNKEGKWFRAKGQGGHGESWVDGLTTARIYGKIGPARATATFFSDPSRYPDYPPPDVVELILAQVVAVDQKERIDKVNSEKKRRKLKRIEEESKRNIREATEQFEYAKKRLEELSEAKGNHVSEGRLV